MAFMDEIVNWGRLKLETAHLKDGSGNFEAIGDYSAGGTPGPTEFSWGPEPGETVTVVAINVSIQDANMQAAKYGAIAALPNGFHFQVQRDGISVMRIGERESDIHTIFDLFTDFSLETAIVSDFAIGDDVLIATYALYNLRWITLEGNKSERIVVALSDDLDGLSRHEFLVNYRIHKRF